MNILLDARPFCSQEQKTSQAGIYSEDFLQALFRNFPSDVFYIWTIGKIRPKNIFSFSLEKYPNAKRVHSHVSEKKIDFMMENFSYPKIDDIAETEAMKRGLLPWIGKLDVSIFLAPYTAPVEDNCLKVHFVNDFSPLHFSDYFSRAEKKLHTKSRYKKELTSADLLVVPSHFVASDMQETFSGIEEEKIFMMGSGILEMDTVFSGHEKFSEQVMQTEEERAEKESEEENILSQLPENFFFARGIFSQLHNFPALLKAYALFCSRFGKKSWSLVIEEEHLGDLSQLSEENPQCISLPPLSLVERIEVLKKAKAFLYPSLYDGVGKPVLEAMRCRTPVLSSHFGALPEVYGEAALPFDPTSHLSILKVMKKIFSHDDIREKISEAGEERSHESQFLWDDIAIRFMGRLEEARETKDEEREEA